jgi:hypothetical protein
MFGKKKVDRELPYWASQKSYMVRVSHAESFSNVGPFTLEQAREWGKTENEKWVKYWHDNATGPRPVTEIWKVVETVKEKVRGVDKF